MAYALERLGWLQFQQLCDRLVWLDSGAAAGAWEGSADRVRHLVCESPIGPPLLGYALPGPVLVQCAFIRSGAGPTLGETVSRLAHEHPRQLTGAASFLLLCNGRLETPTGLPAGDERLRIGILGASEIAQHIDTRPELRRAMPSLLGVCDHLDRLIGPPADASTPDRRAAAELARVFVPTRAHGRALEVLDAHGFAVLTGPPEMGKTAIARMIGLAQMTCGWQVHECTNPDEVERALDPAARQVFIADDAFGSTEYRADAAERWARAIERLLGGLDDRHWLIWTSRPAPLHAALRRLHRERGAERFPSPARVLVDAGDLDTAEKALILLRHAQAAGLPDLVRAGLRLDGAAIVANPHFTPERIRRLIARLRREGGDVAEAASLELTRPTEAMAISLDALAAEHRDLLVALLDTAPGPVAERDLVAALRRHHDGALSHPPVELVDRLADHFLRVLA